MSKGAEIFACCENCVYFRPGAHHADRDGVCRRHPPSQWSDESEPEEETTSGDSEDGSWTTTTLVTIGRQYTGWPDVRNHDWCGEHQLVR